MLSNDPVLPEKLHTTPLGTPIFRSIWKLSSVTMMAAEANHYDAMMTPVEEIAQTQGILFVKENETVQNILNQFTAHKTSFAVVMDANRRIPIATFDVLDLFVYCNNTITTQKIPFKELSHKLEELKQALSKAYLNQIVPYSDSLKKTWRLRTLSASKPVKTLIHMLCKSRFLSKVPILDNQGQVEGVVDIADVLRFILDTDAFYEQIKQPVGELRFTRRTLSAMNTSRDELMNAEFKLMWQKHIGGVLGFSNSSSTLDLFINYVHHVLSGFEIFSISPEPVGQIEVTRTIEELIDLVLRESLDSVYIIDKQPKRIIGVITVIDLLASFC